MDIVKLREEIKTDENFNSVSRIVCESLIDELERLEAELASERRMFHAAVESLANIGELVGADENDAAPFNIPDILDDLKQAEFQLKQSKAENDQLKAVIKAAQEPVGYRSIEPVPGRPGETFSHYSSIPWPDRGITEPMYAAHPVPAQSNLVCDGCGSGLTDKELAEKCATNKALLSCCPDRKMVPAQSPDTAAFKNFHRLLCERFDYGHDEIDWRRDQASLIEHIASAMKPAVAVPDDFRSVAQDILDNDGGAGSKCFDAFALGYARRKMFSLLSDPSHDRFPSHEPIENDDPVTQFLTLADDLIDEHPFLYVEIARTRITDWMAHLRKSPNGEFLADSGQGSSASEACQQVLDQLAPQNTQLPEVMQAYGVQDSGVVDHD